MKGSLDRDLGRLLAPHATEWATDVNKCLTARQQHEGQAPQFVLMVVKAALESAFAQNVLIGKTLEEAADYIRRDVNQLILGWPRREVRQYFMETMERLST